MVCYRVNFLFLLLSLLAHIGFYHLPLSNIWPVSMLETCLYLTKIYPLRFSMIFFSRKTNTSVQSDRGTARFPPLRRSSPKWLLISPKGSFARQQTLYCDRQVYNQEAKLCGVKFALIWWFFHSSFAFNTHDRFYHCKGFRHIRFLWPVHPALYKAAVPTAPVTSTGQTKTTMEPASDKCSGTDSKWWNLWAELSLPLSGFGQQRQK